MMLKLEICELISCDFFFFSCSLHTYSAQCSQTKATLNSNLAHSDSSPQFSFSCVENCFHCKNQLASFSVFAFCLGAVLFSLCPLLPFKPVKPNSPLKNRVLGGS